ncbi:MAG: hypothetical protein GBAus27B_000449 [Mycoplasmataceae bacterium]|nr:MAG: hypothetical protein GBAus27B_000449 [Mycoplasmataceae bacterium]
MAEKIPTEQEQEKFRKQLIADYQDVARDGSLRREAEIWEEALEDVR